MLLELSRNVKKKNKYVLLQMLPDLEHVLSTIRIHVLIIPADQSLPGFHLAIRLAQCTAVHTIQFVGEIFFQFCFFSNPISFSDHAIRFKSKTLTIEKFVVILFEGQFKNASEITNVK